MLKHLCCDGPLNGQYATLIEAVENGYVLGDWPTGERVWLFDIPEEATV